MAQQDDQAGGDAQEADELAKMRRFRVRIRGVFGKHGLQIRRIGATVTPARNDNDHDAHDGQSGAGTQRVALCCVMFR